jgi:hypothetical protein
VSFDGGARGRDVDVREVHEVAFGNDAFLREVDQHAHPVRSGLRHRDHRLDAV